ncbi:MAG: OmpA family protein [Proteobacteria bacterium]|nr:OmpA family protein [Pseudomonadota bacterium]MBU1060407.1 OmpA family protein [Pseudomonadota bacterium]
MCLGIVVASFFLFLGGCSGKKASEQDSGLGQDPAAMGNAESLESQTTGIMEGRTSGPMLPVYFSFDDSSIRADQQPRIQVNADFLKKEEGVNIRVEGNCDPRGTREYNLALGERRALSAKKYLTNLGVSPDRITTVSFGEEKILLHGQDEMAWAQNRRDDFVIE